MLLFYLLSFVFFSRLGLIFHISLYLFSLYFLRLWWFINCLRCFLLQFCILLLFRLVFLSLSLILCDSCLSLTRILFSCLFFFNFVLLLFLFLFFLSPSLLLTVSGYLDPFHFTLVKIHYISLHAHLYLVGERGWFYATIVPLASLISNEYAPMDNFLLTFSSFVRLSWCLFELVWGLRIPCGLFFRWHWLYIKCWNYNM